MGSSPRPDMTPVILAVPLASGPRRLERQAKNIPAAGDGPE
jgi:hypothetical protein